MKAYVFPGQGSQFPGMAKELFEQSQKAKDLFAEANDILGFNITDIMFSGTEEALRQTKVTQPAIFLHSVVLAATLDDFAPSMVAGHSLGEFSSLVANGTLSFENGLKLVAERANAMQAACEAQASTMAAVLGLDDNVVEDICAGITDEIVVPANYNCPGQIVISGSIAGVNKACELLTAAGARRAIVLPVGGAFHSPLMQPARERLEKAINNTEFNQPTCSVYQNVTAQAESDPALIKQRLVEQLTAPVRWTQSVERMILDGATEFIEVGPGKVLQGLVKKVKRDMEVSSAGI